MKKLFWSLFGRFAWDNQSEISKPSKSPKYILEIINNRSISRKGKILDAGCGTGDYSIELAKNGFDVIGIDYANGMIIKAQNKINENIRKQVYFEQCDLNNPLKYSDEFFDNIISISVLQTVKNPNFTLKEMLRVLKTNGAIIISLPKLNSEIVINTLPNIIKYRFNNLDKRNIANYILLIIKSIGDKYTKTIRWTLKEAQDLLTSTGFKIVSIEEDKQILVIGEKIAT